MKKWPIIRHIRWVIAVRELNKWLTLWSSFGYFGPSESDQKYLDDIWSGKN